MSVKYGRRWDKPLIVRPLSDELRRLRARMVRFEDIGCHYSAAANDLTPCIEALEKVSESLPSLVALAVDRQDALWRYGDGILEIRERVQDKLEALEYDNGELP
jgi:hypothetical protein